MKMLSLFAATAALTLLGASSPRMDMARGASGGYPPCSRTVRDRCIQLYERGVATRHNLALNARLGQGRMAPRYAGMDGGMEPMPMERHGAMGDRRVVVIARNDYPPCRGDLDDRCIQAPAPTGAAAPMGPRRVYRAAYDRQLVRTGERG
jgi:hypothetical protein